MLSLLNGKYLPRIALHVDAKSLHQIKCNFDVGLRDQLTNDLDHYIMHLRHEWRCHQQSR